MSVVNRVATIFFSKKENVIKAIIHGSAADAACVGFLTAQIPGDRIVIGGIQVDMVMRLARVYGKRIDRSTALAIAKAALASAVGPEAVNQVIKYIPGVGNLANTTVAGSITEAVGWMAVKIFEGEINWFDRDKDVRYV